MVEITKKQLKKSIEQINKIICEINEENVFEKAISFLQEITFLGDHRGEIHADMPRKGRFLWFFVPEKTYKKQCKFIKLLREIEEIQDLKIGGIVEKSSILYKKETLASISASGDSKKINDTKEFLLQLIKSYEGKFDLDWLW